MPNAANPTTEHRYLVDFAGQRVRFEGREDGSLRYLVVVDVDTKAYFNANDLLTRVDVQAFDDFLTGSDLLVGLPSTWVRRQALGGAQVDVYEVEYPKSTGSRLALTRALVYVDENTGLRVAERWFIGEDELVREIDRRLVPSDPEHEMSLSQEAVLQYAAPHAAEGLRTLGAMKKAVFGLPAGTLALTIRSLSTWQGYQYVSLEYGPPAERDPASVTIETWDLTVTADFPSVSQADAVPETVDEGTQLAFRKGNSGVKIIVSAASGLDVAALADQIVNVAAAE